MTIETEVAIGAISGDKASDYHWWREGLKGAGERGRRRWEGRNRILETEVAIGVERRLGFVGELAMVGGSIGMIYAALSDPLYIMVAFSVMITGGVMKIGTLEFGDYLDNKLEILKIERERSVAGR